VTHVVILGAGLGGTIAAFALREALGPTHPISVVSRGSTFSFVPSNPWLSVGWRERSRIEVDLTEVMARRGITFLPQGAQRLDPAGRAIELTDGRSITYDYLVIATGPQMAFDEVEGLGPAPGFSHSICTTDHAELTRGAVRQLIARPGPVVVGAVQGVSCFGPAYEFVLILEKALRDARIRNQVPITFITPEPYVGHLGLDGVGDTRGLLEHELRQHHIRWITNAKVDKVKAKSVEVSEIAADGSVLQTHELASDFTMLMPAFRGVDAIQGHEGLTNPRGFVVVDRHQRNPAYPEIFAVGVCVAIVPTGKTPLPVGVPKTGFMIESMVAATVRNIERLMLREEPDAEATWNAVCLADFGDTGVAFIAQPQIPPRNVNWSASGPWVHAAKVAFEHYFLHKIRAGQSEPFYERLALRVLGIDKLAEPRIEHEGAP
jgi:sulfide:quinone oxidoreductase